MCSSFLRCRIFRTGKPVSTFPENALALNQTTALAFPRCHRSAERMSRFPIVSLLIIGGLIGAGLAYALARAPDETVPAASPPIAVPDALAADEAIGYR
jgi:hypothetical protein